MTSSILTPRMWILQLFLLMCATFIRGTDNGPFHFPQNSSTPIANPYSWSKFANVLYIDQPVGTNLSDGRDLADSNAQVTQDFDSWLKAFFGEFHSLMSKITYIMGESYAGIYVGTDRIL